MSDILDGPHAEAFSWEKSMEAYLAEEIRERNFLGVLANLRRHGWVPTMSQSLLRPADPDEPNPQQILLRTYYFERSFGAASGAGSANGGLAGLGGAGNGAGSSSLPPPPSNLPSANGSSGGGGGSGGDSGAGSGGANGVQRAAGPTGADQPPTDAIAEKPKTQPPPFRRPAGPPPGNPPPIQRQASNFSSRPGRTPPPPPPIARQQSKDLDRRQALNSLIPATPPASPGHRANRAASTGPVPPVSQGNFGAAPEEDAPYPESHARSPGTHAHTRSMDARQREQLAARNAAYFEDMRRKKQLEDAEREAEEARLPPEEREKIRRKREGKLLTRLLGRCSALRLHAVPHASASRVFSLQRRRLTTRPAASTCRSSPLPTRTRERRRCWAAAGAVASLPEAWRSSRVSCPPRIEV
eukprot:scaffold1272_cov250-Pinguiococcus_pyrenoidosus.AAC.29